MEFLVNYDRHGYIIDICRCDGMTSDWMASTVSSCQNFWQQYPGEFPSHASGSWEVVNVLETMPDTLKRLGIEECAVAWSNGNNRCQCGQEECPRYDE